MNKYLAVDDHVALCIINEAVAKLEILSRTWAGKANNPWTEF